MSLLARKLWAATSFTSEMTEEPKITRLPRNGPKKGQSMSAWLYGKSFGDKKWQQKINESAKTKKQK
jgi:hypothetical protein